MHYLFHHVWNLDTGIRWQLRLPSSLNKTTMRALAVVSDERASTQANGKLRLKVQYHLQAYGSTIGSINWPVSAHQSQRGSDFKETIGSHDRRLNKVTTWWLWSLVTASSEAGRLAAGRFGTMNADITNCSIRKHAQYSMHVLLSPKDNRRRLTCLKKWWLS